MSHGSTSDLSTSTGATSFDLHGLTEDVTWTRQSPSKGQLHGRPWLLATSEGLTHPDRPQRGGRRNPQTCMVKNTLAGTSAISHTTPQPSQDRPRAFTTGSSDCGDVLSSASVGFRLRTPVGRPGHHRQRPGGNPQRSVAESSGEPGRSALHAVQTPGASRCSTAINRSMHQSLWGRMP